VCRGLEGSARRSKGEGGRKEVLRNTLESIGKMG